MTHLKATVDRIEGKHALLSFEDGQHLTVSREMLPSEVQEGSVVEVTFLADHEAAERETEVARRLLNQILRGE